MKTCTLRGVFERSGVGLHSGLFTKVRVLPAKPGEGRYFVRVDLPGFPVIPAQVDAVCETTLSTELRALTTSNATGENACVRTVEHLLAALACNGIDDARIEIDGPEVPLLDGSALVWADAIEEVGIVVQDDRELPRSRGATSEQGSRGAEDQGNASLSASPRLLLSPELFPSARSHLVLQQPVSVYQGDAFVTALPAPTTRFTYGIDFELPAIGKQWYTWIPEQEGFAEAIAPARTFGLAHQIEALRDRGLIKGGSLENALVCDNSGWLNPPLRFSNEPVRHKLLDLVGDLSLLGTFPVAHFLAYKASHNLHIQLAKKLAVAKP